MEEAQHWAARVITLLDKLTPIISSYRAQYAIFHSQIEGCFGGMGMGAQQTLRTIHNEFLLFEALHGELCNLKRRCKSFRSKVTPPTASSFSGRQTASDSDNTVIVHDCSGGEGHEGEDRAITGQKTGGGEDPGD